MAKRWISANKIIEINSDLETYNELHGNGYLAKVTARMKEIDEAIAQQDQRRAELAAARRAKDKPIEEERAM